MSAPKRKRSEKRRLTRLLAVRLTEDESAAITAAAMREGLSVSAYIRKRLVPPVSVTYDFSAMSDNTMTFTQPGTYVTWNTAR